MKRRNFLQILAAAAALRFRPNPAWVNAPYECLPENGMFPTLRRDINPPVREEI